MFIDLSVCRISTSCLLILFHMSVSLSYCFIKDVRRTAYGEANILCFCGCSISYTLLIGKDWIPSMYGANDVSCTSAGMTSCPTMRFWVVLACSTSHTSSANEDWVCLVTSPDFEVMYWQTRSFESVPRRGMVTAPRRSGDVPVVDHPPPGSTRFVVTRVLQRLRPCS